MILTLCGVHVTFELRCNTVSVLEDFCPKIIFHEKSSRDIIKNIISTHKTNFNMFWRFHKYLLVFWTFLTLHFECTKLHLIFNDWHVGWTQLIHNKLSFGPHMWKFWPFFQCGSLIEIWFCKQNCKISYVLALPMDVCEIQMKFVVHVLKALDISSWKMREKNEIITNYTVSAPS